MGKFIALLIFSSVQISVYISQDARFLSHPFSCMCSFKAFQYIKINEKINKSSTSDFLSLCFIFMESKNTIEINK